MVSAVREDGGGGGPAGGGGALGLAEFPAPGKRGGGGCCCQLAGSGAGVTAGLGGGCRAGALAELLEPAGRGGGGCCRQSGASPTGSTRPGVPGNEGGTAGRGWFEGGLRLRTGGACCCHEGASRGTGGCGSFGAASEGSNGTKSCTWPDDRAAPGGDPLFPGAGWGPWFTSSAVSKGMMLPTDPLTCFPASGPARLPAWPGPRTGGAFLPPSRARGGWLAFGSGAGGRTSTSGSLKICVQFGLGQRTAWPRRSASS
jgi:hypothetical protein